MPLAQALTVMRPFLLHVERANRHNIATLRASPLSEISGAFGDLGTLLPIMVALALQGSINLDSTLVFSGLFNVLTGVVFGVPLPVQPMKAIASAALSGRGDPHPASVAGAGLIVGSIVFILSITGLLHHGTRLVPLPVIRGIQHGAGLSLVISAGSGLLQQLGWVSPAFDNRLWALGAFLLLLGPQTVTRFPYALSVFTAGLMFSLIFILTSGEGSRLPRLTIWHPCFLALEDFFRFRESSFIMAIGQVPLTTLNSIIAVSALSADLLPHLPYPSVTSLGLSVAAMNLTGTWLGSMPLCHGSGGLAAQYRFGARSGASIILLGLLKFCLGLFFGDTLVDLLAHFPKSFLGIMVLAAGLELAKAGVTLNRGLVESGHGHDTAGEPGTGIDGMSRIRRPSRPSTREMDERRTVMLMTTAGILAFKNDAIGFAAGMLCSWAYRLSDKMSAWKRSRSGLSDTSPLLN
ncbi:hypothetical protein jhhlp_006123 [Lomentospora prolificans]|uniref:SLC26A/SulP transporter domain-containing protein n=1 Tax=Lomentospora prolificans TaxID=41688 RepID=A0A2N3N507_9PEZI|nr:hypothetical protein jhhlp_006123 [Lomentospora prolificans]